MPIFSSTLDPSDPTPLQPGESRMAAAPWQLPSGGAATPQEAFQNDFATAQDFRDRAIAEGRDPREVDAIYFAPLRTKWKTIAAAPEVLLEPTNFQKFNSEFEGARGRFNSQIASGRDPKTAAEISISPVLMKWNLDPSNQKPKQTGDPKLLEAVRLADSGAPWEKILDTLGNDVNTAKLNLLEDRHKAATKPKDQKNPRSVSTIASDIREWKRTLYNPNISPEEKRIAEIAIQKLQQESMEPFRNALEEPVSTDQPLDRSQMYSPTVIDDSWQRLPLPTMSKDLAGNVPLSPQEAAKYLEKFKGDRKRAEEAARADGYSW